MDSKNKKPTRFSVLKGFKGSFFGRDLAGIFKDGHVYQILEFEGQFIIKDLGEHFVGDDYDAKIDLSSFRKGDILFTKKEIQEFNLKHIR
jgi:hypothetical protein